MNRRVNHCCPCHTVAWLAALLLGLWLAPPVPAWAAPNRPGMVALTTANGAPRFAPYPLAASGGWAAFISGNIPADHTQAGVWSTQRVDKGSPWSALAVVDGQPAFSFDDGASNLKYARFDGNTWQVAMVESDAGTGIDSSLALIAGQPAISYYEPTNRDLKYAYFDGNIWQTTVVDSDGNTGWYSSLAEVDGRPAISYFDNTNNSLSYARFDGSGWQITVVDSGGDIGRHSWLALVNSRPAISYYDFTNGNLKYAYFDGAGWQLTTVDSGGDVGLDTSLAMVDGQPAISYYDRTNGNLKYARYNGNTWQIAVVDSGGDVGRTSSLAVVDGQPAISYYDLTNGDLKYARYDGSGWQITVVDSAGDVGWDTALVVLDGLPIIGYYDGTVGILKVARKGYALASATAGNGSGSVTFTPPGGAYAPGTVVTATAIPGTDSTFSGWSGDCAGAGPCVLVMDGDKSVTAAFALAAAGEYGLTTTTAGTGSGVVTLDPPGGVYGHGAVVMVTATPNTGSVFVGWGGDCTGTAPCVVTMDGDKSITASFALAVDSAYSLTTATTGTGSGTISLNPPGGTYPPGTVVTATAIPDTGSTFAGWSGNCAGAGPCVLVMDGDKSVTAAFALAVHSTYSLTTATIGTGGGVVDLNPPGGVYEPGTVATATAIPNTGSTFIGWSGDCTGTGPCVLVMDSDKSITAAFTRTVDSAYSLTTSTTGTGDGTINLDPPGGVYPYGTVVTLTALADPTSTFVSWSGDCTGSSPCILTMDGDKRVTATFVRNTAALPGVEIAQHLPVTAAIVGETELVYTYQITNSGAVALTVVAVADKLGPVVLGDPVGANEQPAGIELQPGQTTSGTHRYVPQMSDLPGPLVNRVVVTGVVGAEAVAVTATDSASVDLHVRGQEQTMCYGAAIEALIDLQPVEDGGPFHLVVISGPAPQGLLLQGMAICTSYTGYNSMVELTNTLLTTGCADSSACNPVRRLLFDPSGLYTITTVRQVENSPTTLLPLVWGVCGIEPSCR